MVNGYEAERLFLFEYQAGILHKHTFNAYSAVNQCAFYLKIMVIVEYLLIYIKQSNIQGYMIKFGKVITKSGDNICTLDILYNYHIQIYPTNRISPKNCLKSLHCYKSYQHTYYCYLNYVIIVLLRNKSNDLLKIQLQLLPFDL